ncbi:MAG: hypothetical protein NTV06_02900 [candidate division Zixibacteria bacterium]|nr:hypothetical protein [candidate division Zixibacteria bacterium]
MIDESSPEAEHGPVTIEQLIDRVKDFTPTPEAYSPGVAFELEEGLKPDVLDAAGVFANVKPAAIVSLAWGGETKGLIDSFREAAPRYEVVTLETQDGGESGRGSLIFSRKPELAARIKELVTAKVQQQIDPKEYERELGLALGYPKAAVEEFVAVREAKGIYHLIRWERTPQGQEHLRKHPPKDK